MVLEEEVELREEQGVIACLHSLTGSRHPFKSRAGRGFSRELVWGYLREILPGAVPQGLQTEICSISVLGTLNLDFWVNPGRSLSLRGDPLSHRCGLAGWVVVALKGF